MARPNPDEMFMRDALELAAAGLGLTTPNPTVGCVLVKNGKIVGRGATDRGGRPHAETRAIKSAGATARGATAYVTFEPCAHQGLAPPCADALVEAGIKRAVVACLDPYPPVRGRGVKRLRDAGIEVRIGVLEKECHRLNEGFITRVTFGRPFGLLKLAMTLDGRIATSTGDSKWISSPESRDTVHVWRSQADAVMTGAHTVIADDPRLTARIDNGKDPIRVVFDPSLQTSPEAKVYRKNSAAAVVVTKESKRDQARRRFPPHVDVLAYDFSDPVLGFRSMAREFGDRGWCRLLFEGGAKLAGLVLSSRIVDRVAFFLAPRILGGGLGAIEGLAFKRIADAHQVKDLAARPIGPDWLIEAEFQGRSVRSIRVAPAEI